ncbi:LodA/GoxA family CTQ-dependent oxidase [Nocardia sp. NPDC051832]|uniref:LodA/GoxA family CTQ-dependent oxidase n=1 Tax=Nocardia sp. NPDC051832 TaxID=3155673 RepID=UPI003427690A
MATTYRIHPAIGIARVGNSPEFFIGPERRNELPDPPGGFKDPQCRVKRQAARFRIFAHHDDGTATEITGADADITWTVGLVNSKAAYPDRGNSEPAADLIIDPGAQTTTGPVQRKVFEGGVIRFAGQPVVTVPLGEMRTDNDNRLLVFAGAGTSASPGGNGIVDFWGNPGWYDDIADGPVSAAITLHATGASPAVEGAWVISAPPKFAPHQDSSTTLYDRLLQAMVDAGRATAPANTSYTHDVYPILQRARDTRWVYEAEFVHRWPDPVTDPATKSRIYRRLRPDGNMPDLAGSDSELTAIQLTHLRRWRDNTDFVDDWTGVPAPEATVTPDGMDRAALDACVGGAFFPGIEAGGKDSANRPILDPANYAAAFRVDHTVAAAGTLSASMALPWQADFFACGSNWWPVPRPNRVTVQGASGYQEWTRGLGSYMDMVQRWHSLGFVTRQGTAHVEVERCDQASITLLTPSLNFLDVSQGPMGMVREQVLAISFEVVAPGGPVTLQYAPGGAPAHPQLVAHNTDVTVGPTSGAEVATARLWVIYRTGAAPSAIPTQTVTVLEPVSGRTWSLTIDASTVARTTAAVALVLDRSGSMAEDRGDGQSKHHALQQAAEIFVDVMLEGDGVGLVRYNQDAQVVQPVLRLGAGGLSDANRASTLGAIRGADFDPDGATSIGDGLAEGRGILDATGADFDVRALTVLTDGNENRARYIADVAGDLTERTYAIGLGTAQNTSAPALQTISGNNGGYLLVTGAIGVDNTFVLQKHFLQILAGVSNAEVVLDPDGRLSPGAVHRIPFQITDADAGVDVILLSPRVSGIDFRLQTPNGFLLEPWRATAEPSMRYVLGSGVSYYRLVLPAQLIPDRFDRAGTWHVLLTLGAPPTEPAADGGVHREIALGLHADPPPHPHVVPRDRNELRRRVRLAEQEGRAVDEPNTGVEHSELENQAAGEPSAAGGEQQDQAGRGSRAVVDRGVPYSVIVHAYSAVSLRAEVHQTGWEPGASVRLQATVTQSGLALPAETVSVWAEVTGPDHTTATVPFARDGDRYTAEFAAAGTGLHRIRVRARGWTRAGVPFTRETTRTAGVWRGGDHDAETAAGGGGRLIEVLREQEQRWCALLRCLLGPGGTITPELERKLRALGLNLAHLRKCLEGHCEHDRQDK